VKAAPRAGQPRFTRRQLANWRKYEAVRQSSRWNMWDVAALEESQLSRREYLFCLRNYEALKESAAR
jgi:hypothetical protein